MQVTPSSLVPAFGAPTCRDGKASDTENPCERPSRVADWLNPEGALAGGQDYQLRNLRVA
jgi:hypothetical protein